MQEYEYKVLECKDTKESEKKMNEMAKEGWRVISVVYRAYYHAYYVITFERKL